MSKKKKNKQTIVFLEFHARILHAKFRDSSLLGVTYSDGTHTHLQAKIRTPLRDFLKG